MCREQQRVAESTAVPVFAYEYEHVDLDDRLPHSAFRQQRFVR
jgi:hypothetical protein